MRPAKQAAKFKPPTGPITETPAFKAWFGNSKVVDGAGNPLRVFRGDYRGDHVGDKFKVNRSTSGRFYFTEDPELASTYATGKQDGKHQEENEGFENWFRFPQFKSPRERNAPNLRTVWWQLSNEQKERVKQVALTTSRDDQGELLFDHDRPLNSRDAMEYDARKHRGNYLLALMEPWLQGGTLFGEERTFSKILDRAGLDHEFDNPNEPRSLVTPVYLAISRPLDTAAIPQTVVDRLHELAQGDRARAKQYGQDNWDKSTTTPKRWVETLDQDLKDGTTHAWTTMPEKITQELARMGYDGIKDTGGKLGGKQHVVWIAFYPNQIKSALGNKGTFDPMKDSILASKRARPKLPGEDDVAPNPPPEITESPAFQAWFGNSKVVNAEGLPQLVHHQTHNEIEVFDRLWAAKRFGRNLEGIDTIGIWFTETQDKQMYGPKNVDCYLSIQRPLVLDDEPGSQQGDDPEHFRSKNEPMLAWHQLDQMVKEQGPTGESGATYIRNELKSLGYDGIMLENSRLDSRVQTVWIAFEPNQIKSASKNSGGYSNENHSIFAAKQAAGTSDFEYGTVQVNLPRDSQAYDAIEEVRTLIDPDDLAGKGVMIGATHITVRYGIDSDDTAAMIEYLASQAPFTVSLGKTKSFPPSDHSEGAAVLIAPVNGPELARMNEKLGQLGDFTEASFDYVAHATIAYVDPDSIEKYVGMPETDGQTFSVDEVVVIAKNKAQTSVRLGGQGKTAAVKGGLYYHGGPDIAGDVLKPGKSGAIFFTQDRGYAIQYVKGRFEAKRGVLYEVDLDFSSQKIFDPENQRDLMRLKQGFLAMVGAEYDGYETAAAALEHYQYARNEDLLDWATGSQYMEQAEAAGFHGMRFRERPGNIAINHDGSYEISGSPIESVALFDPEIAVRRSDPQPHEVKQAAATAVIPTQTVPPPAKPRKRPGPKQLTVNSPAFKAWFGKSEVVTGQGKPQPVYHGTTHSFDSFSTSRGNEEGYYGKGFYFTDSQDDASDNYAGEGPDLTSRIENRADALFDEILDGRGTETPLKYGSPEYKELREEAKERAREELKGEHGGVVMPCYLKMLNPVIVTPRGGTYFSFEYDEETGEESGSGVALWEALKSAAGDHDVDGEKYWSKLELDSDFTAYEFDQALRKLDEIVDDIEGSPGPLLSATYREMGFDGIMMDASTAFPNMVGPGVKHYIVWEPSQVKSAIGNSGEFNPASGSILASKPTALFEDEGLKPKTKYDKACYQIADDDDLFSLIANYTSSSDVFHDDPEAVARVAEIIKTIPPFLPPTTKKCLYRGEEHYRGGNRWFYEGVAEWESGTGHFPLLSWSENYDTAQYFAESRGFIWQTVGKIQGVSLSDIAMWRMRLRQGESHYSGMQAEWFVLDTHKAKEAQRPHSASKHAASSPEDVALELNRQYQEADGLTQRQINERYSKQWGSAFAHLVPGASLNYDQAADRAYVVAGGKFYDPEAPAGVASWNDLPFYVEGHRWPQWPKREDVDQVEDDEKPYGVDHPYVKPHHNLTRDDGGWGASHGNSSTMTGEAAKQMGIPGYRDQEPSRRYVTQTTRFLQAIADDDHGAQHVLYHSFENRRGRHYEIGDTIRIPLTAAAGDKGGYGIRMDPRDQEGEPTLYEFPIGTPMAGYSRWKKEDQISFGYIWSEAIVAGEFRVTKLRYIRGEGWRKPRTLVVSLECIQIFDPATSAWRQPLAGVEEEEEPETKTAADMIPWQPILTEMMAILKPGLPTPAVKIVNRKERWLGMDLWSFRYKGGTTESDDNTVLHLQKSIMSDETTLRRIIAHELAHHEDNLVNEKAKLEQYGFHTFRMLNRASDGHGAAWLAIAARFNNKYGEGFVTPKSDESYVVDEGDRKPFFVLMTLSYGDKLYWQHATRLSPKMVTRLTGYARDNGKPDSYQRRLFMVTDPMFQKSPTIGLGGDAYAVKDEDKEKVKKLWGEGDDILDQYDAGGAKQAGGHWLFAARPNEPNTESLSGS